MLQPLVFYCRFLTGGCAVFLYVWYCLLVSRCRLLPALLSLLLTTSFIFIAFAFFFSHPIYLFRVDMPLENTVLNICICVTPISPNLISLVPPLFTIIIIVIVGRPCGAWMHYAMRDEKDMGQQMGYRSLVWNWPKEAMNRVTDLFGLVLLTDLHRGPGFTLRFGGG